MICITISQESRRLALVDMLNAAPQCDLMEIRLDRFAKSPDFGELFDVKSKPVVMCCRRPRDGGAFQGTEEERLAILRQCIVSKADYVEIELDVADQIRPFPPSKRVISYTNLEEVPADVGEIYAEMLTKKPDVVKLTIPVRTPEEAWPLVQILAKPQTPTVVVGLGKPGVMLTLLGRQFGSPWTYAALERGMEGYADQPTITDLKEKYRYSDIGRGTRLLGVTGFGPGPDACLAVMNAVFASEGLACRCLPLEVGTSRNFEKVIRAVRLSGVVVDEANQAVLSAVAGEREHAVERIEAVDLLLPQNDKWHGYNVTCRAAVGALESELRARSEVEKPLENRTVMIVGGTPTARALAYGVKKRGGAVVIAHSDRDLARQIAQQYGCRHIAMEALYTTLHDVLVVCGTENDADIHAGYLKPGMTVMDLSELPKMTQLLREARDRGCTVVTPQKAVAALVSMQLKLILGKEIATQQVEDFVTRFTQD